MKNIFCVLFCAAFMAFVASRPQTQLKWNWEEVILSRNGPSTTTTPRPTRWTTTTLRFIEEAPVVQSGSVGTVEDAYLVPRRREAPRTPTNGGTCGPRPTWTLSVPILGYLLKSIM